MRLILLICFCFLSVVACSRADKESTKISISLPNQQKAGALSACSSCLKFIAINISGPGIVQTIYAKKEHGNFQEAGTEISDAYIEIEVPVGSQRQIQMIAAYNSPTAQIEIKYGTAISDLASGGDVTIELPLASLGTFQGGHIAGRYLNGANTGPTGLIDIKITPIAGMPKFTLLKSSIVNGWFDFFASKNFEMTYSMANGQDIFSDIKLDDDFTPTSLASSTQVARVVRPTSYFRQMGPSTWINETEDSADIVYGFFFAPGLSDPNKKVCKAATGGSFSNLASTGGGTPLMTYDPSGVAGDVKVYGGVSGAACTGSPLQQYEPDTISLNINQFDGNGNDNAKSIEGVFSYFLQAGQIRKFGLTGNTYYFKVLPDIFVPGGFANGVKLFYSNRGITDPDNIRCTLTSLSQYGFSEVNLNSTPLFSGTSLSITVPAALSAGNLMVCPTLAGVLRGFGGMYLGAPSSPPTAILNIVGTPPYNFSTIVAGGVLSNVFTLTNTGAQTATTISEVGLAAPYSFAGGSFPGTGGTCGATLNPSNSCTMIVNFSPTTSGVANDVIDIQYYNGSSVVNTTFSVTGTGIAPALLTISDGPTYDFGSYTSPMGNANRIFTVTNNGGIVAGTILDTGGLMSPFGYVGGSFPGTSGTCTPTLPAGNSCTINIEFNALSSMVYNDSIELSYYNGASTQIVTRPVQGTGL